MTLSKVVCYVTCISVVREVSSGYSTDDGLENTLEAPPTVSCFKDLGCFGLEYPWVSEHRPLRRLPDHPADIGTTFYLSTRSQQGSHRRELTVQSLGDTDWDARRWTVFLTHGFRSSVNVSWIRELESALLHIRDLQVISCDWSKGSSGLNYKRAAVNARVVGAEVARLISHLIEHKLASSDRIHLIGQSLGAHALSYVSATVKNISRLTALDPAQPGFEGAHPDTRVDPTDALFVEVIHTNADHFIFSLGLGMITPIGHVDFFVNGGKRQPGCSLHKGVWQHVTSIPSKFKEMFADMIGCSHQKACVYYIESLKSDCSFWGRRLTLTGEPEPQICSPSTCQKMGLLTSTFPARGTFHVTTNTEPPYCIHEPISDFVMGLYRLVQSKQANTTRAGVI